MSAKSGVGIKSTLIREIRQQCAGGIGSQVNRHPSISLEEAYDTLKVFDANNCLNSTQLSIALIKPSSNPENKSKNSCADIFCFAFHKS